MPGTKAGAAKAMKTIKKKYGDDFFSQIGREGGRNGHTGGFYANRELARKAGAKGGKISRRGPAKKNVEKKPIEKKVEEDIKKIEEGNRIRENFFRKMFRRNK